MKYRLHALAIWEKGDYRDNQEDTIYPAPDRLSDNDRLFMVCDGMGGHEAGEVASQAVVEGISTYLNAAQADGQPFSDELLRQALDHAYDLLDERDPAPDSIKRMGTTMALLRLHADGATAAHIGDSRIYQFRPTGKGMAVIYRSRDHSLVNDLVKVGEMTPEEARTSPLRNRLTRAMQAHLDSRPKAEVVNLTDIRHGDYFLLCSDGMLENADDDNLCFMIGKDCSDEEKVQMLIGNSRDNRDNHSAILIHILDVATTEGTHRATPQDNIPMARVVKPQEAQSANTQMSKPRNGFLRWLFAALAVIFAAAAYYLMRTDETDTTEAATQQFDDISSQPPQRFTPKTGKAADPQQTTPPTTHTANPEPPPTSEPTQSPTQQTAETTAETHEEKPAPAADAEAVSDETQADEILDEVNKK